MFFNILVIAININFLKIYYFPWKAKCSYYDTATELKKKRILTVSIAINYDNIYVQKIIFNDSIKLSLIYSEMKTKNGLRQLIIQHIYENKNVRYWNIH